LKNGMIRESGAGIMLAVGRRSNSGLLHTALRLLHSHGCHMGIGEDRVSNRMKICGLSLIFAIEAGLKILAGAG